MGGSSGMKTLGKTIVVDPTGEVTRIPNASSRMADLQNFQQAALATLSQGPQCGSGDRAPRLSMLRCNCNRSILPGPRKCRTKSRSQSIAPTTSGFVEVVQLQ